MRILVTRPKEDGEETAARLAEMGHQALLAPLLFTHYPGRPAPDLSCVQALLATSANGVRAFVRLSPRRDLPLFAVGPQTAAMARQAGFTHVEDADGGADDLAGLAAARLSPDKGALLHLRGAPGRENLAAQLEAGGFVVRGEILYEMRAAENLPAAATEALRGGRLDAALFYSPRSAEIFRACLVREGLRADALTALCISPATAQALEPLAFAEVRIAARPNQDSLLALLA
jgi:uroporphyrinogen-III synthase